MKKKVVLLVSIISILIVFSCKKFFTNPNTYILKGKVYSSCDKTPLAGIKVIYVDNGISGNGTGIYNGNLVIGSDTSKIDGSFEIKYKLPEGIPVLIEPNLIAFGINTLYGVPATQNIDSLELFSSPTCVLNIKLNALRSYTNADTLWVNNLITGVGNLKIPGPFTSGLIYSIPNYTVLKHFYIDAKHPAPDSSKYVGYSINNHNWQEKSFVPIPCKNIDVTIDVQ